LVGDIGNGVILACYSVGSVSGIDGVGGLVGANDSATISACFSTSSVTGMDATSRTSNWVAVGGLVGSNGGMISACYSTGAVKPHPSSRGGGGLVGREYDSGTVLACFWDVETSGQVAGADGIGLPTTQMQTAKSFLDAGWDFLGERANGLCDYWQMPPAGGYPVLTIFNGYAPPVLQGAGTSDDPYLLETADDFGAVWCEPKAHYQLVADASLSGITWAMAVIPAFGGSLDGQGHRITGMKITGGGRVGLIGFLSSGGVIKNLGVEDVNNVGTGDHVGALVGYNDNGTISACWSTGSVSSAYDVFGGLVGMNWQGTISACHSTCTVSGKGGFTVTYAHAGGLVGANWFGTISACCSTGSVSGFNDVGGLVGENYDGTISACYSTGSVGGGKYGGLGLRVGGLVGTNSLSAWWAHSTISACYSTASVNGGDRVGGLVGENRSGTISACYSAGSVSGGRCVGGLVGQNDDSIAASFWDTLTSGQPNMCGEQMEQATGCDNSCGKTTAEMQTAGTFLEAGWDFVGETANGTQDSWWINEGKDYPRLWWEATATAED